MTLYFFDTYAIIELLENNPYYARYSEDSMVTFQFNLIELFRHFHAKDGEEIAKKIYFSLKPAITEIPDDVIFEAMKFRKEYSKKNLSYVDCLGYIYAKKKKIRFLTGDNAFKGMKNVEFVK